MVLCDGNGREWSPEITIRLHNNILKAIPGFKQFKAQGHKGEWLGECRPFSSAPKSVQQG